MFSASLSNLKYLFLKYLRSCNVADNFIGNGIVNETVNDVVNVISKINFIEHHY